MDQTAPASLVTSSHRPVNRPQKADFNTSPSIPIVSSIINGCFKYTQASSVARTLNPPGTDSESRTLAAKSTMVRINVLLSSGCRAANSFVSSSAASQSSRLGSKSLTSITDQTRNLLNSASSISRDGQVNGWRIWLPYQAQ